MCLFDIIKLSVTLRNRRAIDVFRTLQALSACTQQLLKCIRAFRIRRNLLSSEETS